MRELLGPHTIITPTDLFLALVSSVAVAVAWFWSRNKPPAERPDGMGYLVIWIRYFFGVHALISGANYFLRPETQMVMAHPLAGPFQHYMDAMGLFAVIKVIEVFCGLALTFNVFVPVALLLEMPVSFNIFYLSFFIVADPRTLWTGPKELLCNLFLLAAYGKYFLPLLKPKPEQQPLWK